MPEQIMKRLVEEIKLLERELTTELPAEIKRAVAMGDLSENAEYHMAKQRQVFVNARLGQLKKRMGEQKKGGGGGGEKKKKKKKKKKKNG